MEDYCLVLGIRRKLKSIGWFMTSSHRHNLGWFPWLLKPFILDLYWRFCALQSMFFINPQVLKLSPGLQLADYLQCRWPLVRYHRSAQCWRSTERWLCPHRSTDGSPVCQLWSAPPGKHSVGLKNCIWNNTILVENMAGEETLRYNVKEFCN